MANALKNIIFYNAKGIRELLKKRIGEIIRYAFLVEDKFMKIVLILFLLLTNVFGVFQTAEAQTGERQKIQVNKQKTLLKSKLTIKFLSLVEDSRCPEGTRCIHAGNAQIKIEVSKRGAKETFELNTNTGAKSATFDGYAIELISLTPVPKENIRINRNGYVATFAVSRSKK